MASQGGIEDGCATARVMPGEELEPADYKSMTGKATAKFHGVAELFFASVGYCALCS